MNNLVIIQLEIIVLLAITTSIKVLGRDLAFSLHTDLRSLFNAHVAFSERKGLY